MAKPVLIDLTTSDDVPETLVIPAWIDKDTLDVFLGDSEDESSYTTDLSESELSGSELSESELSESELSESELSESELSESESSESDDEDDDEDSDMSVESER